MTANYKILCNIGKEPIFSIGGESEAVGWEDLDKEENLNRIYRIQFNQAPHNGQLERVTGIIKQRPEIELRFYGDFSEELIDWDKLTDIRDLQIDLWNSINLGQISKLTNLKCLGITKNVKSNVSLSILEPLQNLEKLYTSVSKDIESIGKLKRLQFVSLSEIKYDNLDFL